MIIERMEFRRLVGVLAIGLTFCTLALASAQTQPIHKDAKLVMIVGRATGKAGDSSALSVQINGVEFSLHPHSAAVNGVGQSADQSCLQFQEQIAAFRPGSRSKAEFEAFCLPLAGEAALLVLQPSVSEYPPPSAQDEGMAKWLKVQHRLLYLKASSTDDTQRLYVR